MIESIELTWRKDVLGFALYLGQAKSPLLHVVPDAIHAGMWRVRLPDGRLSHMVNLARAKDAGVSVALGILNSQQDYRESPPKAPPFRQNGGALDLPIELTARPPVAS
jgi:hypothetical protein